MFVLGNPHCPGPLVLGPALQAPQPQPPLDPVTLVSVLFLLLAVGFGATLLGRRFRWYSIATIVTLVVVGVLSGQQGGGQAEANLPTPWLGLEQRINA
jgi:hypothetical protein